MDYDDLSIEIRTLPGGGYEARAVAGSQGFGRSPFEHPVSPEELEALLRRLERQVWRSRLGGEETRELETEEDEGATDLPEPPDLERFGEELYAALFQGGTGRAFHAALGPAEGRSRDGGDQRGLRIRFVFDLSDAEHAQHALVPWESLRWPERREYLARYDRTPVVRKIAVPRGFPPLRVEGALRVLLAEAAPGETTGLQTSLEAELVREALERLPGIEVTHLPRTDFRTLSEHLRSGGFHVLHFMGHGDFEDETGEAVLCLDGGEGPAKRVDAATLAENAKRSGTLRLVVLNACETATLPRRRGQDPYAATAAALALAGVPAVLAMQFPITDRAAVVFGKAFYESLARREALETAVVDGRLAICGECDRRRGETLEWVTPVLYLQAEDGVLLGPETEGAEPRTAAQPVAPGPSPAPRPLRLGIRSMEGLGEDLEEKADRSLSLVDLFEGRHIRDEALWHGEALPRLREFLTEGVGSGRPLILDLAAHQSLAFAAGSFLEAKSGVEITVVQRGQKGTYEWPARPGEVSEGPFWEELQSVPRDHRDPDARDVAVAVSATWDILERDVLPYLEESRLPVRRALHAVLPEPAPTAVRDGAHALRLAHILGRAIRGRTPEERQGTVHLFAAAPNALLVFLGQLAPALGPVQLYEFDFPTGPYRPSFRLPE